ncbi:polymeric immunoglobulin receptor-like isoform X2 [Erpetoichthys calabaricus]|uniref:polymeric immunoglobulin receptor-like isoform X2 n=1 Tax=Erpetoichthys calabaricus TaxID=27687 RepID=UPI002234346A|nr:polymeric immunoglobulin receptor-like isoform X2 [Erpetoichthys calabaricus]
MAWTKLFILLLVTYQGDCVLRAINSYISGFERQSVSVKCAYDQGYAGYVKYWCRGEDWDNCETVQQSDSQSQGNKIVINDFRGVFTVTINSLEKSDAGTYWCAIQRWGYDYNAHLQLEVKEGVSTLSVRNSAISGFEGQAASMQCSYNMGYSTFVKYFCRGDRSWNCEIMRKTSQSQKNGDKFFLTDDKTRGVFTMTINRLEKSDVGSYWCGIEKLGHNNQYAVVRLDVKKGVSSLSVSNGHVSGFEGRATSMQCSYNLRYSNFVKYWCRGDKPSNCITLHKKNETQKTTDKFFIRDDENRGVFTMTINSLERSDTGSYWCGIEKLDNNKSSAVVKLSVVEGVSTLSVSANNISGFEGQAASVQCFYHLEYSTFAKYWCRGDKSRNCDILTNTSKPQTRGDKIVINDNQDRGVFTVTFNRLERSDSGSYWCGIEKLGHNVNAVVTLTVLQAFLTSEGNETNAAGTIRKNLLSIIVGSCGTIFIIAMIVLVLAILHRRRTGLQNKSVDTNDCYATISNVQGINENEYMVLNRKIENEYMVLNRNKLPSEAQNRTGGSNGKEENIYSET